MMDYQKTLDYLFSALPMYHRIGAAAYKADIKPTIDFMSLLGNPHERFHSIHVAGTNGKGSVSHLLASILQEQGYKVGLYTSPHLLDFRERIRIDGQMIESDYVAHFVEQYKERMESLHLSFFEMTVGLAFDYFAKKKVDVAVVEVGMGGRLDSTNIITPDISVITNIAFDHTQFLGTTLPQIASEKAGIIKRGVPVVIGQWHEQTQQVFRSVAKEMGAPITFADSHYVVEPQRVDADEFSFYVRDIAAEQGDGHERPLYRCPLSGSYQRHNIATVFEVVDRLRKETKFDISDIALRDGMQNVVKNTHLQGRWQKIGNNPLTICETAHNMDGISAMIERLTTISFRRLYLVYGCVNDKDYTHILTYIKEALIERGIEVVWVFSQPSVPRGLAVEELVKTAKDVGIEGDGYRTIKEAITKAREMAEREDMILITGSIFLVADALSVRD